MLVLARKTGETIVIDGHIRVTVMKIGPTAVRLGVEAPKGVSVHREEVADRIKKASAGAGESDS